MTELVTLRDEQVGYVNRHVLANVSVSISAGEKIALLGRSGAGKSTLLTLLYRRLERSQPTVALVPQDDALVPSLSVYHNIFMGRLDSHTAYYNLTNLMRPRQRDVEAVGEVARAVGLEDNLWQTAATLSGGQKQRTALARALYRGGPIVLADEPVSAVDVSQGGLMLAALGDRFDTVVLAMHDVELAFGFAGRVIGLKGGGISFDGPPASIAKGQINDLYAD